MRAHQPGMVLELALVASSTTSTRVREPERVASPRGEPLQFKACRWSLRQRRHSFIHTASYSALLHVCIHYVTRIHIGLQAIEAFTDFGFELSSVLDPALSSMRTIFSKSLAPSSALPVANFEAASRTAHCMALIPWPYEQYWLRMVETSKLAFFG